MSTTEAIDHILLQRFNTGSNAPQKVARFSLRGSEIKKVVGLLKLVESGTLAGQDKFRIEESDLQDFAVSDDAARSLVRSNPELIADIARNEITKKDVIAVAYRKNVLERFRKMLDDDAFFGSEKTRLSSYGMRKYGRHFLKRTPGFSDTVCSTCFRRS